MQDLADVSVLVPYRGGCTSRAMAWAYVRARYREHHPDWELAVADSAGEWSKGAALALAANDANGEVLVVADADVFVDVATLRHAVELAAHGQAWVVPHRTVRRLGRRATDEVLAGAKPHRGMPCRRTHIGVLGGGLVVLRRAVWDAVGGVDARFIGWGGEDVALARTLETFFGPCRRLDADLWHLWHPPQPSQTPHRRTSRNEINNQLAGRYREAQGDAERMRILITERAG